MKVLAILKKVYDFISSIYSLVTYFITIAVMTLAITDAAHNGNVSKKAVLKTLSDCRLVNDNLTSTVKTIDDVHEKVKRKLKAEGNVLRRNDVSSN